MSKRNYTIAERAAILIGVMAGCSREEINQILQKDQKKLGVTPRELPEGSYQMLKKRYLKAVTSSPKAMWSHILHPQNIKSVLKAS